MSGGPDICYFAPQRYAVRLMLEGLGAFPSPLQLYPVTYPQQLAGLRTGTIFVHVINHGSQLPPEILEAVRVYGLIEIAINDEWMRLRHYSRPATEPPLGVAGGADSRSLQFETD